MLPRRLQSLRCSFRPHNPIFAQRRWQSQPNYEPPRPRPPSQSEATSPHRAYYKSFGLPTLKVLLGAMLTYQVLYWFWLKLESVETKRIKEAEVREALEKGRMQLRVMQETRERHVEGGK